LVRDLYGARQRPAVSAEELDHAVDVLKLWDVQVAYPVDRLDLQGHVIGQDIGNAARYGHHKLRSWARREPTTASSGPYTVTDSSAPV
jgi:hypothetical protein